MQGACRECKEMSAKWKMPWCCVKCVFMMSGMNLRITEREGNPVMLQMIKPEDAKLVK